MLHTGPTFDPKRDGVTHLNVYSRARISLGRFLTNFAHAPFTLPQEGRFASVEAYWYWLSAPVGVREQLRDLHGWQAKKLGRKLRGKDFPRRPDFEHKIRRAIRAKLQQHPERLDELARCTLPLTHYMVYGAEQGGDPRVVPGVGGEVLLDALNRMRDERRRELGLPTLHE